MKFVYAGHPIRSRNGLLCKQGLHVWGMVPLRLSGLEEDDVPDKNWWCSLECKNYEHGKKKRATVADNLTDHKKCYALRVMWHGLNQKVRRDALRENDGKRIIMHWRFDLLNFYEHNHPKYLHVCHQLLSAISGAVSPRLQHLHGIEQLIQMVDLVKILKWIYIWSSLIKSTKAHVFTITHSSSLINRF